MALNLDAAACASPLSMTTRYVADTLDANLTAYWKAVKAIFDPVNPNHQPILNWVAIIAALATDGVEASDTDVLNPVPALEQAISAVWRVNFVASMLNTNGLISNAEATAMLAAWNTNLI